MFLNIQIISDNLTQYKSQLFSDPERELSLAGPKLLAEQDWEISDRYIYIATSAQFLTQDCSQIRNLIVTAEPAQVSALVQKTQNHPHSILLLYTSESLTAVFNSVVEVFSYFNETMQELLQCVSEDADLSRYLNVACHLFHNPIILLDTALTVVTYTKDAEGGISPVEEIWPSVVRHGHVSINAMNYYENTKEPEDFVQNRKAFFHTINPDLYHSIRVNLYVDNLRIGRLLIPNDVMPLTRGHLALADLISPLITRVIQKYEKNKQSPLQAKLSQFVSRQLDGFQYASTAIIQKYLHQLSWTIDGNYFLLRVTNDALSDTSDTMRNDVFTFLMRQSASIFDSCIFTMYRGAAIYIINTGRCASLPSTSLHQLLTLANTHALKIGISSRFDHFSSFKEQYTLLFRTMELAVHLTPDRNVFFYDDYQIFNLIQMFASCPEAVPPEALCCVEAKALWQYDQEHHSKLLDSMFMYLLTERSLLKAAERLHIHRNSLVYRLDRAANLVKMDLDDSTFRQRFLVSCYTLYYCHGNVPIELINEKDRLRKLEIELD